MKQIAVVFKAALLIAVLASLAACSGGTFVDPGHEAAGGGDNEDGGWLDNGGDGGEEGSGSGGGGGKPAKLSSSAGYSQAIAKLDEITAYCNTHPGNDSVKSGVQSMKTSITSVGQTGWSYMASQIISSINSLIDILR
jgi:hypothetical protein